MRRLIVGALIALGLLVADPALGQTLTVRVAQVDSARACVVQSRGFTRGSLTRGDTAIARHRRGVTGPELLTLLSGWRGSDSSNVTVQTRCLSIIEAILAGTPPPPPPDTTPPPPPPPTDTVTPPPPPPGAGVVLRCNWSTATGATNTAHSDGGCFSHLPGALTSRGRVLEVVPGAPVGWTATPNVLQVTQHGPEFWGFVQEQNKIPQGASYFVRFYARLGGANTIPTNHPVKVDYLTIQAVLWMSQNVRGGTYQPGINLDRATGPTANGGQRRYVAPAIAQPEWHRFELHVEVLDQSGRHRIHPRVYNAAGELVADASRYTFISGGQTLAEFYAGGGYNQADNLDLLRRLTMGYEGTAGTPDLGERWYYAAVEVRTDTWPGPVR